MKEESPRGRPKVVTLAGAANERGSGRERNAIGEAIRASNDDELEDALHQFHGIHCLAHIQMLRAVVQKERRGSLQADGVRTAAEWLVLKLGLSRKEARTWSRVAHALEELPAISDAYERGEICWDSVRHLTRFATAETDAELAGWATGGEATADHVRAAAERRRTAADKVGEAGYAECYVNISRSGSNAPWRLSGLLTAEQGATLKAALQRMAEEPQKAQYDPRTLEKTPEHDDRTWGQRYADALTEMASAAIADEQDPDRATVVLHVELDALRTRNDVADVDDGAAIPPEVARRIACDCRLQVSIDDRHGRTLDLGRTHRTPNASLLRALRRRDEGCRFPGCGRTRFLRSHHIQHWIDDGPTSPKNLVLLCSFHHRLVHEKGWSIRGNPEERVRFVRPDGRKIMMGPLQLRPAYRERLFRNSGPLAPVW